MARTPLVTEVVGYLTTSWSLVARCADPSGSGLKLEIEIHHHKDDADPKIIDEDTVCVTKRAERNRFAEDVAAHTGLDASVIDAALIDMSAQAKVLMQESAEGGGQADGSVATQIVKLVEADGIETFNFADKAYATFEKNGHIETWPLRVGGFRSYLAYRYFLASEKAAGSQALQDAIGTLEGKALHQGETIPVYLRVAQHEGTIYIDLVNDDWQAIEIKESGWQIIHNPPVKFRRTKGMLPLPVPEHGGDVSTLKKFLNLNTSEDSQDDWILCISWLLDAFRSDHPYAILALFGDQGSTKTTMARAFRKILDPNKADLRTPPRDEHQLSVAANNSHLVAYDNLSRIQKWLSDKLCRLATGDAFGTRTLYTDEDETLFEAVRPILLNGITEFTTESDLIDRTVSIYLPDLQDRGIKRLPQKRFWKEFESALPGILGGICDVLVTALKNLPDVVLDDPPRMADFAEFAYAAAPGLGWTPDDFLCAYKANRKKGEALAMSSSVVATAIKDFMTDKPLWAGSASELLDELNAIVPETTQRQRIWPKAPNWLSNRIREIRPNLKKAGIEATLDIGHRGIVLRKSAASDDRQPAHDEEAASEPHDDGRDHMSV